MIKVKVKEIEIESINVMFSQNNIAWDWIGDEILYSIPSLVCDNLSYLITNQTWDRINGGIYYLQFFLYLLYIGYVNHMLGYVNHMLRYEICTSYVS